MAGIRYSNIRICQDLSLDQVITKSKSSDLSLITTFYPVVSQQVVFSTLNRQSWMRLIDLVWHNAPHTLHLHANLIACRSVC